jgi:hypothetical protein
MAFERKAQLGSVHQGDGHAHAAHGGVGEEGGGGHHGHLEGLDRAIGLSLVLGFLFMMLIDQVNFNF